MFKTEKGITLIALIITIIVMLVLVGVTINVAVNGGLFEKGEKAAYQTNVSTIKEQVALKIADELAGNNGRTPTGGYTISIGDLDLSSSVRSEFENKLAVSKSGTLYYIEDEVTAKEIAWLEEIGVTKGVETVVNPVAGTYYLPSTFASGIAALVLNEDGTLSAHEDAGIGEGVTYEYTDTTVTGSNGMVFDFYNLGNNKILVNESLNWFLATNRTGFEFPEALCGTYSDENGNTFEINENDLSFTLGGTSSERDYFYYDNKIYTGSGTIVVEFNDNTYTLTKAES